MFYERLEGMALSLRKQPGRTFLVVLAGTSLVLFFLNQSDLRTPFTPHPAHLQSAGYYHRRIQDYSSPEYTAPGESGGETASGTARETGREGHPKEDHDEGTLRVPLEPLTPGPGKAAISSSSSDADPARGLNITVFEVESDKKEEAKEEEEDNIAGENSIAKDHPSVDEIPKDSISPTASQDLSPEEVVIIDQEHEEEILEKEDEEVVSVNATISKDYEEKNKGSGTTAASVETRIKDGKAKASTVAPQKQEPSWISRIKPATKKGFIVSVIEKQREVLAQAMEGYNFHHRLKARKMDDLVLERGGRPVRSIVITTWRSGSTFIGDVLQSHPATYYHYEPLLDFDIKQVRHGELARQATHNIRHLLTCNYTEMEHYLEYGPNHPWLFTHNKRLWYYCTSFPELCWDSDFLSPFCSLFPFQSLKTVRLRLNLTREFLEDKSLGVQVLLLVRDPRGTMQSRRHRDWCPGNPDCDDPARLCSDLVSDHNTAVNFRRKFPHAFRVVRYEDLSFNAYNMTRELFDFFHLSYHPRVQEFLDTHTKEKIGGVSSTFRNSKTAPIHWQQDLSWQEVERIQKVCSKALKLWGYEIATDEKHLRSFMPVGAFKFR